MFSERRRFAPTRKGSDTDRTPSPEGRDTSPRRSEFDTGRRKTIDKQEANRRRGKVEDLKKGINHLDSESSLEIINKVYESNNLAKTGDRETDTEIKALYDNISNKLTVDWDDLKAKAVKNEFLTQMLDDISNQILSEVKERREIFDNFTKAVNDFSNPKKALEIIANQWKSISVFKPDHPETYDLLFEIIKKDGEVDLDKLKDKVLKNKHLRDTLTNIIREISPELQRQTASNTSHHLERQSPSEQLDNNPIIISEYPYWNINTDTYRSAQHYEGHDNDGQQRHFEFQADENSLRIRQEYSGWRNNPDTYRSAQHYEGHDNDGRQRHFEFQAAFFESGLSHSNQLEQEKINDILRNITHYFTPAVQTAFSNRVNNTQVKAYVDTMLRFMQEHCSHPTKKHGRVQWKTCNFGQNVPTFTPQIRSGIMSSLRDILPNAPTHMLAVIRNHLFDAEMKQSGGRKQQTPEIPAPPDGS